MNPIFGANMFWMGVLHIEVRIHNEHFNEYLDPDPAKIPLI